MSKYFTIVIRAEDEAAARRLVPGGKISGNVITACALGDALSLNDEFKKLIPDSMDDVIADLEAKDLAAFVRAGGAARA